MLEFRIYFIVPMPNALYFVDFLSRSNWAMINHVILNKTVNSFEIQILRPGHGY